MTFSEPSMPPHKIASAFSQLAANHLIGAVNAMNRRNERPLSIALRSGFTMLVWQRSIMSTASSGGSGPNWRAVASGQVRERPRYPWQ